MGTSRIKLFNVTLWKISQEFAPLCRFLLLCAHFFALNYTFVQSIYYYLSIFVQYAGGWLKNLNTPYVPNALQIIILFLFTVRDAAGRVCGELGHLA